MRDFETLMSVCLSFIQNNQAPLGDDGREVILVYELSILMVQRFSFREVRVLLDGLKALDVKNQATETIEEAAVQALQAYN